MKMDWKWVERLTENEAVRGRALGYVTKKGGAIRKSMPGEDLKDRIAKDIYGADWPTLWNTDRAAAHEVMAIFATARAVVRMYRFHTGLDTSMPVLALLFVSQDTAAWADEVAFQQALREGQIDGTMRWLRVLV